MSSPKFIFVTWFLDYFELPVVSLDIDGFEGSDNTKFIFLGAYIYMFMCVCEGVCVGLSSVPVFSSDCLR